MARKKLRMLAHGYGIHALTGSSSGLQGRLEMAEDVKEVKEVKLGDVPEHDPVPTQAEVDASRLVGMGLDPTKPLDLTPPPGTEPAPTKSPSKE